MKRFCPRAPGNQISSKTLFVGSEVSVPQNRADEYCGYCFLSYRVDCISGMPLAAKGLETFVYHYYRTQQNFTFTYRLSKRKFHYSG
jgi:hypothetical protein